MKITKIELFPISMKFTKPMIMSCGPILAADGLVIKIHTDEGITGIAETGDTSVWYMGDSQDSMMSLINNVIGPQILLGEDPRNIEKIVSKMDVAIRMNSQGKALIDYALHDIKGKALNTPVYNLLGGKSNPKTRLCYVMSCGAPDKVAAEGVALLKAGFRSLKLKVGMNSMEEDLEMIAELRKACGPEARIMIDANQAWHYNLALRALKAAEKYDIFLCEQPVPRWDFQGLARLRQKVNIPIFADEAAAGDLNDLHKLIQMDAIDGFFLKVPKAGGLLKSQKFVAVAQAADLMVMCGCMINSGLGAAVEAHFLTAMDWMGLIEQESIGPLNLYHRMDTVGLTGDLAKDGTGVRYEAGYLYPPEAPGLGPELNEEVMKKLATPGKKPTSIGK
jgi:L-alanine-DL-glutamate epimerase-like enolase superfamily enzyme